MATPLINRQLTVEEMKEKREAIIQSLQSSDNKTDLPNESKIQ